MSPAMYHQFVVHTEPDLDASCARKQCHPQRSFNRGDSCQCDVGCARHEDCCHDYVDVCGDVHEDLPPISIPHDEVSEFQTCEHKSCGPSGFHRLDLCQCDAYCTVVGDCCDDFEDVCAPLDAHCPSQSCACPRWLPGLPFLIPGCVGEKERAREDLNSNFVIYGMGGLLFLGFNHRQRVLRKRSRRTSWAARCAHAKAAAA